ncbi:26S proteasome non-ATPase regulatory subunit 4, partial [Tanacetum coccineum]
HNVTSMFYKNEKDYRCFAARRETNAAIMICIDDSKWMLKRPLALQAQADAFYLICAARLQSNPENNVGVLTLAGNNARVLCLPTTDDAGIDIRCCSNGIWGNPNLEDGIMAAEMALKPFQNENQLRILLFIGGPVKDTKKRLEMIGKRLKENNVAVDVVSLGKQRQERWEKLEAFVAAVNNKDNSRIVLVEEVSSICDALLSSPKITGVSMEDGHSIIWEKKKIELLTHKNEKLRESLEVYREELQLYQEFAERIRQKKRQRWTVLLISLFSSMMIIFKILGKN